VLASFIYFTYQVFFTSLILWRGMKVDFNLSPVLNLFAEALRGITQYIGFPVDVLFILAVPFLYFFDALASINVNLSSVNITCSGSQAPIELLFNCIILGFLIIVVRSDYQLLFNVLLNNVNQRFLLNNLEQQLDKGNFWFSRYFFMGIIFTGFIMINPFQVGLRYCMGFVRLDSFAKNHKVAHEVSQACDQVPGARYFDSFLGYTSSIFAWWLILPAVYCLAEVVVPKCRKTNPLKMINTKNISMKTSPKIIPAELFIDENIMYSKKVDEALCEPNSKIIERKDEENGLQMPEQFDNEIVITEDIRTPEFPNHLSAKFPGMDEKAIASIYQQGLREGVKIGKVHESMKYLKNSFVPVDEKLIEESIEEKENPSFARNSIHDVTKKMPFLLAFYLYCKEKYFMIISVDLWISNTFASWINFLQKNTSKKALKDRQEDVKNATLINTSGELISAKQPSVKKPGMKQLLSLDSEHFLQSVHVYGEAQLTKQRKLDSLWQREQHMNHHTLPSYYELSLVVQEELHEFIIQPFSSILALIGIGHFFTPTGRYYWNVVFHNYKVFLLVCLGIWTDEAVEAYDLKEKCIYVSVDDSSFLRRNEQKASIDSTVPTVEPRGRKFSAELLGFTITQAGTNNNRGCPQESNNKDKHKLRLKGQHKENFREVLPSIISILICSRVILFQIVPSLVLFATISMTLASFPLFIFSEFLAETLPPLIVWGEVNREMSIEKELKSFIPLDPETKQALSEPKAIRMLTEEYSWRLHLRGTILFWNDSRLLQFVHSSLALFFSFLLLIYTPELLIYLVVILALLIPFILSKSLVLLLYLGNSLDLKDKDFPKWLRQNKLNTNTARVEPDNEGHIEEESSIIARIDSHVAFAEEGTLSNLKEEEEVRMYEIPVFAEKLASLSEKSSDYNNSRRDENSDSAFSEDEATSSFSSIDLDADIENSWILSSSNTELE
jgi:hypothetical protein